MFKIGIQRFTLLLVSTLAVSLILLFVYLQVEQRENTASVILKSINAELSEVNYIISKNTTSKEDVIVHRPLLDRVAANNDFISAILIHDGHKILLSTDPSYKTILPSSHIQSNEKSLYDQLNNRKALEGKVRFYTNNKINTLSLMFMLDKEEIDLSFYEDDLRFLALFVLIPLFVITFIWIIVHKFVINPLELLRQFAYYQESIPKTFMLQELEVIRHSMVETFERIEKEKKELYAVARTDSLSGLANRNSLMEYLQRLITNSQRKHKEFAMLFLDLDHFKSVNDSLGHNVGDELLKKISTIIDDVLRSDDFVARVGGDEFVIILQNYTSLLELTNIVERIQNALKETFIIQANPISINSSIGIAFYPKDGASIVDLMKNSDIAMYEAKKNGRGQYHFFTEELNKRVQDSIALNKDMRDALLNDEYELFYQPKIDMQTDKIIGAEALIRWNSPSKGLVSPNSFIPLAEENGFIVELGEWIYNTAILQQKLFKEKGINTKISINLSSKQLLVDDFINKFTKCIEENGVHPSFIDIEITEYMFYKNNETNIKVLNAIHDYGITISLDDFGTGYSSLSYLKDFPIDSIKIDKSFIDDFDKERNRVFVDTIVKMGQTLKMNVIAEGVETKEQLEYLKRIECNQYQGYYCSKPVCVKDFEDLYLGKNS